MSIYPLSVRLQFGVDVTVEDVYEGLQLPEYAEGDKIQVVLCFGAAVHDNRMVIIHDAEITKDVDSLDVALRLNDEHLFEVSPEHVMRLMKLGYGRIRPKNRHYDLQDTIDHAYRGDGPFFCNKDKGLHFDVTAMVIDFEFTYRQLQLLKKLNYIEQQVFISQLTALEEVR